MEHSLTIATGNEEQTKLDVLILILMEHSLTSNNRKKIAAGILS